MGDENLEKYDEERTILKPKAQPIKLWVAITREDRTEFKQNQLAIIIITQRYWQSFFICWLVDTKCGPFQLGEPIW